MSPLRTRGWSSRMTAAAVSAALVVSTFAPGSAALAADVTLGAAAEAPAAGGAAAAVQPLSLSPSLLGVQSLAPLSAPSFSAPSAAVSAGPASLPVLGGHSLPAAAVAAPQLRPAAPVVLAPASAPALLPAAADGPIARLGAWLTSAVGLSKAPGAAPAGGRAAAPSDGAAAAPSVPATDGGAKEEADVEFGRLTGEDAGPARPELADPVSAAPSGAPAAAAALAPIGRFAGLVAAEGKVRASAKGRAGHLRLLRVSANLAGSGARWTFAYHAPAEKRILTYGPNGVDSRKLGSGEKPAMLSQEELAAVNLDRDLAAVKAENPEFKPVRADVLPRATGGFTVVFFDARRRSVKAPAAPAARAAEVPSPVAAAPAVEAPAEPAPAAEEAALPSGWSALPAEARETEPAALLAAKAEAQERARRVAPDARLVSVAINLQDPRSHWIFVFRSDKSRREITVWTKSVGVRKLGFFPTKAPTLRDGHLGAMGPLERAHAAVEKAAPSFRPVRVEADPAWNGPASYRFLDADGREISVGADGAARLPAAPLALNAAAKNPPSFAGLPEDARGADGRSLLALKAEAAERAARLAPDARLIGVAIDLNDANAHWVFTFRSDKSRTELTVWTKRIQVKRLSPKARRAATVTDESLAAAAPFSAAYAALKAEKPGLKPVRAVLTAAGGATWSFLDARGRGTAVEAAARPAPVPAPEPVPEERGPPAETPAPPAEIPPAAAPDAPVPPAAAEAKPAPAPAPETPSKYIYEDFLGFRAVRGVKRDAALGRLPADADVPRIIAQISGQFGIARDEVMTLGKKFRLDQNSKREAWLAVYDRLQAANLSQFKRLDSKKYEGWSSFRKLANRTYPPGWRGALLRASELHKHLLGFAVRFPYHLFDMFLFGYFRQAISFEFAHSSEDFIAFAQDRDGKPLKDQAKKWLEAAMREQAFRGAGVLGGLRAQAWFRQVERWFVTPLAKPLVTFMIRRLTLAVMSAIAMGVLGAFAPALPLSFALTSLPLLGPGIVWALNGVPVAAAAIPFVGHFLAPLVSATVGALAKDLVLGPLLNTMILSTLLTFPAAARERMAQERDKHPMSSLSAREVLTAVGGAAVSWEFWRTNLKSFFGLATVGAEIAGIMTYAAQIDAVVDPGFQAVTGHKLGLFEKIGSAVERPKGQSSIPFGGAITWGSVLLYKLQDVSGIHISETVMGLTLGLQNALGGQGAADPSHASAAAVVHLAETRDGWKAPFDPDLWKKSPAEVLARIKDLAAHAGGLDAELAAVKSQMQTLDAKLGDKKAQLAVLEKQSKPTTPEEKAEYEALLKQLGVKRDQTYVESKLAERHDLANPVPDAAAELQRLKALQQKYIAGLPPPPDDRIGYWEQLATQQASYKALSARLTNMADGTPTTDEGPVHNLPPDVRAKIDKLVGEIETQRQEVEAEMAQRDATTNLIQAANAIRNHALNERRNGADMMRFHTDFAKLATVMDLALSLNEISAALAAIQQMENLLQAKQAAVNASQAQNAANQAASAANQAQIAQWTAQANAAVAADQSSQQSMVSQETEANMAAARSAAFQQNVSALIAGINATDKGSSPDAMTQYQANLNMLAQVAQWRTNGNPSNPSAFSLASFKSDLATVNGYLTQAQTGLGQIAQVPVEFASALVVEVPGPAVTVSNPSHAQVLQILTARQTYWQQQLATYQSDLTQVKQMADPNNVSIDEFGLPHGYNMSVTNMATLHPGNPAAGSKTDAQADMTQLDAIAGELNGLTGSHIPLLSGLSLTDLQTAIKNYGTALEAVKFPQSNGTVSPQIHQAEMDLILAGQLTPMAARAIVNWSVDQATIDTFNQAKAPGGALTVGQAGLTGIVNMINAILNDVTADQAFENTGQGGGQALIDRKTALLKNQAIPALTQAQSMLGVLMAYQQSSIAGVTGNASQYYTLFSSEQTLMTQTQNLYNQTVPWALASFGGSYGDVGGSLASIANWKQSLNQYITGYTDAQGFHEGITQYQQDMKDRQCASGCTRTEVVYGETQPYSLPTKISQYGAEQTQRAAEINAQDAAINQILTKIQTMSNGQYNLSAYMLPTGLGTDAASVAKMQAIIDGNVIPNLGAQLKTIGTAAQAAGGGGVTVNVGGNGTVPVGTQPSPTISNNQQIALLALAAAERLVPTPNSQASATNAPEAFAVARYMYSNAVVSASQTALTTQVPQAVTFLQNASAALGNAISQTNLDVAYVNSNGSSETPNALYARKIAMFRQLDSFLQQGIQFYAMKTGWDQGSFSTITSIQTYYNSLNTIYANGQTANASETTAINTMLASLQSTAASLTQTQQKVTAWMSQLDPVQQSALNRVSSDVSTIQDKTRAVLEANINWHQLQDQLTRSRTIVASELTQIDDNQQDLAKLLNRPDVQDALPADLVRRIEALRLGRSAFALGGAGSQTQALVIKKSEFSSFLDATLGMLTQGSSALAHQDVTSIKTDLMSNPQGLAAFIPGSSIMNFGDNADGFYLVYQSQFSVPGGLDTGDWVTLGNIAQLWGNNVSLNGYAFSSPPSADGTNAPYGDKGVEVQVESLQNENSVNYLNVDMHRFGLSIPSDNSVVNNVGESRLMVFDDYAMMLMDGKLYVGLAGYGDMALQDPAGNPYYYGANLKTSLKLTEVMSLNASQQELFAKDPRQFLENVNLDFTGYDPSLNQNFPITATGDNKYYSRTQVGPSFDVNRLLHPDGGGDTFTVDMYYAKTAGTDDYNQSALGTTIVKGFSIKDDSGKTWLQINNSANAEVGQVANTYGDRISFTLPDKGITLSGQGELIGGQPMEYAQLSKKTGDNTTVALGYGSQYIGEGNRLSLTMNTSFTLAQLWQTVADNSARTLAGGETLQGFNKDMAAFFGGDAAKTSRTVAELSRVYEADVARKLISQDIGTLTKDIQDLRKAGAFMDNTRVRGMVGFTSNAASNDQAELAVAGGFTVGTYTEMTLTKTQKQLIADKSESLYREGLRLQDRLMAITKDWQAAVVDLAQAQWDLKLETFEVANAPSEPVRREAAVRLAAAQDRAHQALLNYNAMTGRDPGAASPLADLSAQDLQQLMSSIQQLIAAPDRFQKILGQLDPSEIQRKLGPNPFNVMDWIPWIDKFSLGFGVQYQDIMEDQALTIGGSVRLPIYDPASKDVNKAYALESKATIQEMAQDYQNRRLLAAGEHERAVAWAQSALAVSPQGPAAAARLSAAIRGYRNGLIGPDEMRSAFDDWRWYARTALETQSQASLAAAQEALDAPMLPKAPLPSGPARITSLDDAFALASQNSHTLAEVAERSQAAEEMARAEDHRVQKFWVDIGVGTGLTAKGLGFLPSIGITGIPVTPVFGFELKPEELRELQVKQHTNQQAYYDALKTRLEAGLAVQFYQNVIAYRSAQDRVNLYDQSVLPALQQAAQAGGADAARKYDEAKLGREQAALAFGQARATLNLLLGRASDAPLDIQLDERQALVALSQLLTAKNVVANEHAILGARVEVARAVEDMVDKNLKVDVLQLEPVSLVVRSLGRLIGALGDGPVYNADNAAAARISTLNEERALEAYDGQRADLAARLRAQLNAAKSGLEALKGRTDPGSLLKQNDLAAAVFTLQSGLLAIGENPDVAAPAPDHPTGMPSSWAEARRRLASAEQALSPAPPAGAPVVTDPETETGNSGAYMRYYYANQTLGHVPIDKSYVEGWIEVRLKDPNTPPDVLLKLSALREEKAARIYKTQQVGAAAQGDILSAQFEADVRLRRWAARQVEDAPDKKAGLQGFRDGVDKRLGDERDRIVALLGLPPATTLDALVALVPEDGSPRATLPDLADEMIKEIRDKNIDSIRRTLFEDGLPSGMGSEDDLMSQIKANTISERMSYKGFTPVLAAGEFRGTAVGGAFLEAPDPRDIERALENVMSDVLRKQLESDGRLHELSLHLNSLMTQVQDGANELEAQRHEIEAAESDLKARTALSGPGAPEVAAAEQRLIDAWAAFSKTTVDTKSAFITLVTELEALGEGSTGSLRPLQPPVRYEPNPARRDSRSELLDFWTERLADPNFEAAQDALLAKTGAAVPADARARIRAAAASYRTALKDADAVRDNDFSAPEKLDLLTRNDVEGKRLALRAELERAISGLGALDPRSGPAAADLIAFFRAEAEKAAAESGADRGRKRAIDEQLRETFWGATAPSPAAEAAFRRLEGLEKTMDDARESLLTNYLADAGDDPSRFVIRDLALDSYLKAQSAFDAEMAKDLESPAFKDDMGMARVLDGLHDVRASLDRSFAQAKYGRGIAALDALVMLEQTRLRAAQWGGRPPTEIDRVAESLQNLKDLRAKWTSGTTDLEPVYALTRSDASGDRTWTVDGWMTAAQVDAARHTDPSKPVQPGEIVERDGRLFIDDMPGKPGVRYEVVGGVDAAEALRDAAKAKLTDNAAVADLSARMKDSDFVSVGTGPQDPSKGLSFADVFGPAGLHAEGKLFFFESGENGRALNPLAALALPPEKVVMMRYDGATPPDRDRFPTLQSLRDSDEGGNFHRLAISPRGAAELASRAQAYEDGQLRRGWIETKLNSAGFARDGDGRMVQLYRTPDDFQAQWKAFDHADRDLADARKAADAAAAVAAARKADADKVQAAYAAALRDYQAVRDTPEAKRALAVLQAAADKVKADPASTDGPLKKQFDVAQRDYQAVLDKSPAKKAFDAASKALKEAGEKYKEANAKSINARKAVTDAETTLAHSKTWTLYRTSDLDLSLDAAGDVVRAAAPAARGATGAAAPRALDSAIGGGGPVARHAAGALAAAVVDEDGRLVRAYASGAEVDAAAASWKLVSFSPDGDVDARLDGGAVRTKVRLSHYEETEAAANGAPARALPVLLSERYLIDRLDESRSRLKTADHWAIEPYNWGNIVLEIPRGVVQAPFELLGGRDPGSQNYLGRAAMYKTEGGETEHHGFFRTALGWVDVLNLLPDPVARYYDPSQFPDAVRLGAPLNPGKIVPDLSPRDAVNGKDVKFGKVAMARETREAAEDLDAARERTLARFNGGVEVTTLETMRGRGHQGPNGTWVSDYLDSTVKVQSGGITVGDQTLSVADQRLREDPVLAASPNADGSGEVRTTATPGALFVDRVETRTQVYPGASGYDREVHALDGYGARVDQRAADAAKAGPQLAADLAKSDKVLSGRLDERAQAVKDEDALWNKWHALAEKIGAQEVLEERMAALRSEIKDLQAQLDWWANYARQLDAARHGQGPVNPGPVNPGPGNPGGLPSAFWALLLVLFGLGGLIAAGWWAWRDGLLRRPRAAA